ncbi:PHP domain-containing protein [Caldisalinibacter kiritimatiensis]|uniref:Metal-dependent phosphoesterases (PHP family) n=1 Tax=Caldisalinibacter kiritimatiensis TaxID=1304284 RepID=R1CMB0_9FIRM|nr:PHP domain-containing protein [Caldisalinibacter kiritimatiensis]EOC99840.1 Metal-dependent phosphoesterases (PHP family) [Caldisalinibacter kiritimatiensis]
MKFSIDLHIHSGLSPCGDEEMTPNNIVNMAYIKELDIISVTDHNSMENVKAIMQLAEQRDLLVIPGMEVTTKEEIHVLCYFKDLSDGLSFQKLIYNGLPDIENQEDIFGKQIVYDTEDKRIGKIKKFLLNRTCYSIEYIYDLVKQYNGVMVPAHIDKKAYSILSVLGFIPKNLEFNTLEITNKCNLKQLKKLVDLKKYNIIQNSDAHYLKDINEPLHFIDIKEKSIEAVFDFFNRVQQ